MRPDLPEPQVCLGVMLQAQGILDDALACFETALSLNPSLVEARWLLAMAQLALVHGIEEKPEDFRASFSAALGGLKDWFQRNPMADGSRAVGMYQPFYLAYHDHDNRASFHSTAIFAPI